MNVHVVISIWSNLYEGSEDHREVAEAGYLLGDYSTYDAINKNARKLVSGGFDGWWCDSTEPFTA